MAKNLPIVSIIGRPNVGKSCLFNRMLGKRSAIVHDEPGVTRDRNYLPFSWNNRDFMMVDTGGMVPDSHNEMEKMIGRQVEIAIAESELILFVVDASTVVTDLDAAIAGKLRQRVKDKTILIANKSESPSAFANVADYCRLGLGEPLAVSAIHGQNVADLLDMIVLRISVPAEEPVPTSVKIRIAILGQPNVGKSSLVNALCRQERVIVDGTPGTTRDSVDIEVEQDGVRYVLIDTAGMRKKGKVKESVEYYSSLRSFASLDRCDLAFVLIDAEHGFEEQDRRIFSMVADKNRGIVMIMNKWDKVDKEPKLFDQTVKDIKTRYTELAHVPILSISALTGQRLHKVLETGKRVYTNLNMRVNPAEFSVFVQDIIKEKPPRGKGRWPLHLVSVIQENVMPPLFVGRCNHPHEMEESYARFLRNRIQEKYGFEGCPIRVKWKGLQRIRKGAP